MAMNLFLFDTLVSTSFPSPAPRPAHLGLCFLFAIAGPNVFSCTRTFIAQIFMWHVVVDFL